jgi:hypothetical protein
MWNIFSTISKMWRIMLNAECGKNRGMWKKLWNVEYIFHNVESGIFHTPQQ